MADEHTLPEGSPRDDGPATSEAHEGRRLAVDLVPGQHVHVTVGIPAEAGTYRVTVQVPEAASPSTLEVTRAPGRGGLLRLALLSFKDRLRGGSGNTPAQEGRWAAAFFVLSLGVYAFTRLYRLAEFPIYFFSDEAVQTVLAGDFLRDHFHDYFGTLLPTFFENGGRFCLGTSVYLQLLPTWLFGNSVFVTRAGPALVSLFGSAAVALSLRRVFRASVWWSGVMLMAITPAWFLHSRTAFEYSLMVSFYAWFLYGYLLYRTGRPRFLFLALLFGALSFYSYSPGQMLMLASGLALLILDFRYHWQQRRVALPALGLLLLLAAPYLRFLRDRPQDTFAQLRQLDSYWLHDISVRDKLSQFVSLYARSLSPTYWYLPHGNDLPRHSMDGFAHILWPTFPFALLGLGVALRNLRSAPHRVLLMALLASPLSAAIVGLGVTRSLAFVVPAATLTGLGLEAAFQFAARRFRPAALHISLFVILAAAAIALLAGSLRAGPFWYGDYGMGGLQYGARQVFAAAEGYLEAHPASRVLVSANWANGTDVLLRFFVPENTPVFLTSTHGLLDERQDLSDDPLLILTEAEVDELRASPKVGRLENVGTLAFPDGSIGFDLVHMTYSDLADSLFAEERAARLRPVVESAIVDGGEVTVQHPYFDSGNAQHMFDGDVFTFVRSFEANPVVLQLTFVAPRALLGLRLTTGSMDLSLVVRLFDPAGREASTTTATYEGLPPDPTVEMVFDSPPPAVSRLEIEILQLHVGETAKIHIREIVFE